MPYPTYEERVAFRKLPEEKRKELWDKMTPQERSDISGYGAEDDPGYCDINGRCFDNDEDAEYVDSWIKENEKLKEENKKLNEERKWVDGLTPRQMHEMFLSKKDILEELAKARKANMENFSGMCDEAKKNEKLQKQIDDYWKVDDEIGGFVSGTFPDIASHLRECWEDKERIRKLYCERNRETNKLKEEVNYWKNFALVYWSGNQLGNLALAESCDSVVWNEALEECNSNDNYDREALTKKCLQKN